jgi:transposase
MNPCERVTRRLAAHIPGLCRYMTIKEIVEHLDLDWKTVKEVHKLFLKEKFSHEERGSPRILVIDEISIKKRHRYLTIIADWESGRVLGVVEGRSYESLRGFFVCLSDTESSSIEAVAMYMWNPYIKAVKESFPQVKIFFEQFHIVTAFGRVIDQVRNIEYHKASEDGKAIIKGSKYLLLKNKQNLREEEKPKLKALLDLNEALSTTYILKDYLKRFWQYRSPHWAINALTHWGSISFESGIEPIVDFVKTLLRYAYGIINYCIFPIHMVRLEGINNKIKVINRKAYRFHGTEYFSLVIKGASTSST